MRFLLFALLLLVPASAMAEQREDQTLIIAAIDRWDHAWQIEDPILASQDYSDDAHWVNAFGMQRDGRAAIRATLTEVFALPFVVAGKSETKGHDVRFLGEDVAFVTTKVERTGQKTRSDEELGIRRTSHLRIFERRDEQWRIVAHLISDARDTQAPTH